MIRHAQKRLALVQEANQCAPQWNAAHEGLGAVHRIENPDKLRVLPFGTELFADDAVRRVVRRDERAHGLFRSAIGNCDGIEAATGRLVLRHEA